MSYTVLAHVTTGDLATASLHNSLIDDLAVLKTEVDDNGLINWGAPRAISANVGLAATDKVAHCTGTITVSLLAASGNAGKFVFIKNVGSGTVTVNVSGGGSNIDSAGSINFAANDAGIFYCDGTQWWIHARK